ncbi:hypothetical protein AWV80_00220 [Cupriavidus sp. UYMU48A]|nr:hypothetical protein AWV80_00220 [Cupriavidus sp. UYMU48A]
MKSKQVFDVQQDVVKGLQAAIERIYAKQLAALPKDTSPQIAYFRAGGELLAEVTFYFPKSAPVANFARRRGEWVMTRDWND